MNTDKLSLEQEKAIITASLKDPSAFRPLYEAFFEEVFRFSYHRIGDKEEASEMTSITFYKAITKLDSFEQRGISIKSWLLRIAFNEIQMYFRNLQKKRSVEIDDKMLSSLSEEAEIEFRDHTKDLVQGLDHLSDSDLEMIEMKYYENLSHQEIADINNISVANAKVKLHRALKKLRENLLTVERNEE